MFSSHRIFKHTTLLHSSSCGSYFLKSTPLPALLFPKCKVCGKSIFSSLRPPAPLNTWNIISGDWQLYISVFFFFIICNHCGDIGSLHLSEQVSVNNAFHSTHPDFQWSWCCSFLSHLMVYVLYSGRSVAWSLKLSFVLSDSSKAQYKHEEIALPFYFSVCSRKWVLILATPLKHCQD